MIVAIGIVLILTLMIGSLYLQGRIATNTKREMGCIVVADHEYTAEVRGTLEEAGIFFSDMLWSPSQSAYNQLGTAQRTPAEIWIKKDDVEKARHVLELRYNLEIKNKTIIVHGKISSKDVT